MSFEFVLAAERMKTTWLVMFKFLVNLGYKMVDFDAKAV